MLFASSGAGVSSHPAANASSPDFDAILAALTPDTRLPHLPAVASLSEYASLHEYRALPSPTLENSVPAFAKIRVSLPATTIPALKSSVALPVAMTPVTTRDYREPDQDTPKPAAPSRTVAPPSVTWNVQPQPIVPIRAVAAPAPASASPVFGISAPDDGADHIVPPAAMPIRPVATPAPVSASPVPSIGASDAVADHAAPSTAAPPSNLTSSVSQAVATDEPDQAQESNASPVNLPRASRSETLHSTSGAETTTGASAETPHTAITNSATQQSSVRIAPGTALPQHVVDAIMAAAAESSDLLPAAIPARSTDRAAQPDPRPEPSNVKGAAPNLPPADSDRIVKTPPAPNVTSRVEAVAASASRPVDSGSQQPVSHDANQVTPPPPAKTADIPLKVLEPIVKAAGANVTMRYEEVEPDQAARQSPPTVANTDVSDTHREMQPAQPRVAAIDHAAAQSYSRIVDSSVADPRPQQNPAPVEPGDQPSAQAASPEIEDVPSPVRNASATVPADTAARQTSMPASEPTVGEVRPETHQSPVFATPSGSTPKQQAKTTEPELTLRQTQQKPVVAPPADQIAKTEVVADPKVVDLDAAAKRQADTSDRGPAAVQTQQKQAASTPAVQVAKTAPVADREIADLDAQSSNANPATTSPTASVGNPELADTVSQGTQKPASVDQSAPEKNADASKPQAVTQAQTSPVAVEAIDPAEMLVSETVQASATGDVPVQARGSENKAADASLAAPKANGSSNTSPRSEPQAITTATPASAAKATGDTGSDASADNSAADGSAVKSQTDSAAGKVESAQAAPSGVPTAPAANQPGGTALVTGVAQTAVTPAATSAATATASAPAAPAAPATAEPAPDIDGLAVAIAANATRGIKHFDIRLDPPELGRVDVHMSVSRDGKAEALLTADRPETLELLQRDSKTLERALKDAGLDLSNNSLNFSLKGQQRQGDGGGASMARMRSLSDAVVARAEAANASTPIWSHAPGSARLDIRV